MSLRHLLLEGLLPDPFARKFSKQPWDVAYLESDKRPEDVNLYRCLEIILPYKDAIISTLMKTAYGKERKRVLVERLLMYNTMNAAELGQAYRREARKHDAWTISRPPKVPFGKKSEMAADDLNTTLIDALKLPIEFLLLAARNEEPQDAPPLQGTDEDIPQIIALASAWKTLRDLWTACAFTGISVQETDEKVVFGGKDRGYFVTGKARYMQLNMSRHIEAVHSEQRARNHLKNTDVGDYKRDGESINYRLPENPLLEVAHFSVGDFMRQEILPAATARNSNITYHDVMKGFDVLSDVATEALQRLAHPKKYNTNDYMLDQLCRFSRSSLVNVVRDRGRIDQPSAESIIDILSYNGSGLFDPWATPIISLDNNSCCLLPGVFCFANRAFVLESILRNDDFDMDSRGPAFEQHVHSELTKALAQCRYRGIVRLAEPAIHLTSNGTTEEIDILICLGKEVFLIEAKCTLFPVEARSEHFFREKMHEADVQLERKVSFLRAGWPEIYGSTGALKNFPAVPTSITGAIITNFHGGPLEGLKHPICEPSALVHYLIAGKSVLGAVVSSKKSDADPRLIAPYYDSFITFRQNFDLYLRSAPHVLPFSAFLNFDPIVADFRDVGVDVKPIEIAAAELLYPQENESLFEKLNDVAQRIRSTFRVN